MLLLFVVVVVFVVVVFVVVVSAAFALDLAVVVVQSLHFVWSGEVLGIPDPMSSKDGLQNVGPSQVAAGVSSRDTLFSFFLCWLMQSGVMRWDLEVRHFSDALKNDPHCFQAYYD